MSVVAGRDRLGAQDAGIGSKGVLKASGKGDRREGVDTSVEIVVEAGGGVPPVDVGKTEVEENTVNADHEVNVMAVSLRDPCGDIGQAVMD